VVTLGTFVRRMRPDEDDMDEPILPDVAPMNGTAALGTAEGPETTEHREPAGTPTDAGRGALAPTFLAGLASAMRKTATKERDRISAVVAADAATHIEKVRSRAAIETEELRRLAEEDVQHVDQWSAAEIERIQRETAQKIEDRRSSLEEYLRQHDAIIDTEIKGVDGAVHDYEATLDRFFADLGRETDPSAIVRQAGLLPAPPDLDEIRATARATAMTQFAEAETEDTEAPRAVGEIADVEAIAEAAAEPVEATGPVDAVAAAGTVESDADSPDDGGGDAMIGVMDDGVGSVEPVESTDTEVPVGARDTALSDEASPDETRPVSEPVGVMDPDAQRVPNWPAAAPSATAEPAQISPTVENTSAAVRLLRSVAPWTAPTHAGGRSESDPD
jgi:hypothetical protein